MPPATGQNLDFLTHTSRKSAKLFARKLLSSVCCMKSARAIIKFVCWSHKIASSIAGVLHDRVFLYATLLNVVWVKRIKVSFNRCWRLESRFASTNIALHCSANILITFCRKSPQHHAFQVKMNLTFMRHRNAASSKLLCRRVQGNAM